LSSAFFISFFLKASHFSPAQMVGMGVLYSLAAACGYFDEEETALWAACVAICDTLEVGAVAGVLEDEFACDELPLLPVVDAPPHGGVGP